MEKIQLSLKDEMLQFNAESVIEFLWKMVSSNIAVYLYVFIILILCMIPFRESVLGIFNNYLMKINIENDGPVTILLDSEKQF